MKRDPICGNTDHLVAFLYDECDPIERVAIERHLIGCSACAGEVASLRAVRLDLQGWTPPDVALGIRVSKEAVSTARGAGAARASASSELSLVASDANPGANFPANAGDNTVRVRPFWSRPPAWAQLAAAVLVLAAGAAIANVEIRYNDQGIAIRTGWSAPRPAGSPEPAALRTMSAQPATSRTIASSTTAAPWRADLTALERELRKEIRGTIASAVRPVAAESPATLERRAAVEADVMRQVRALIDASEQKQQRELALQIANVVRDVNVQRRTDLARIAGGIDLVEGRTGAAVAEQQRLLNALAGRVELVRVSQPR
jgi:hypothetical protein